MLNDELPDGLRPAADRRGADRRAGRGPRRRLAGRAAWRASASRPATSSASCAASPGCGSTTRRARSRRWTRSPRWLRRAPPRVRPGHDRPRRLPARERDVHRRPPERDLRLGAGDDRRSAGRHRLPARHLRRARRPREHRRLADHGHAHHARLPDPRRARRALRGALRALDDRRAPGTRRSRCGSRRSSSRAPTSAGWPAPPTIRSSIASRTACPRSPSARGAPLSDLSRTRVHWTHVGLQFSRRSSGSLARTPARMVGDFRTRARLLISQGTGQVAVRRAADRLEATAARSGYRRRRQLDHPPDAEALVAAATVARPRRRRGCAAPAVPALRGQRLRLRAGDRPRRARRGGHHQRGVRTPAAGAHPLPGERHPLRGLAVARRPQRCARPPASAAFGARWPRSRRPARRRSCTPTSASTTCARRWRRCPTDQRQVMVLRLIAGLTPGEVAERLGRSVDAVHALQHRARRRLREELTQAGWAPTAMAAWLSGPRRA